MKNPPTKETFKFPSKDFQSLPAVVPSIEMGVRKRGKRAYTNEGLKPEGLRNNRKNKTITNELNTSLESLHRDIENSNYKDVGDCFGEELIKTPRGATAAARMMTKEWDEQFPQNIATNGSTPKANVKFGMRLPSHILPSTPKNPVAKIRVNDQERLLRNKTIAEQKIKWFDNPSEIETNMR
eukprot:GHVP01063288.1.p1 GENE.GHVP01063288.1~~GHVP01063288.1.p1  ORF type:complete len:182 (+),score=36.58 GHVP01063288.1:673-1218(+)